MLKHWSIVRLRPRQLSWPTSDLAAAEHLAARYNIPKAVDSPDAVISDPTIDAIVLCTPTNTHADLIAQAAQAGEHIFCEKPISQSLAEIDASIAAVEAAGVKMQWASTAASTRSCSRVRRAVENGEIGTPNIFHIVSRDPFPPPLTYLRPSGGIFLDMMIHDFDMARFLMGEVEEVFASGAVLVVPGFADEDDFDTAIAMLKFTSGAIGTIDDSRKSTFGYDQRVEILGSKGKIASDNRYSNEVVVSGENVFTLICRITFSCSVSPKVSRWSCRCLSRPCLKTNRCRCRRG